MVKLELNGGEVTRIMRAAQDAIGRPAAQRIQAAIQANAPSRVAQAVKIEEIDRHTRKYGSIRPVITVGVYGETAPQALAAEAKNGLFSRALHAGG